MHAWSSDSLLPLAQHCHKYVDSNHWIYAPGTHRCWVVRGNVDSQLAQGLYTWPTLLESQTPGSWVQCLSNIHSLHMTMMIVHWNDLLQDMNEPSDFVDGSLNQCTSSKYDNPPYTPGKMQHFPCNFKSKYSLLYSAYPNKHCSIQF